MSFPGAVEDVSVALNIRTSFYVDVLRFVDVIDNEARFVPHPGPKYEAKLRPSQLVPIELDISTLPNAQSATVHCYQVRLTELNRVWDTLVGSVKSSPIVDKSLLPLHSTSSPYLPYWKSTSVAINASSARIPLLPFASKPANLQIADQGDIPSEKFIVCQVCDASVKKKNMREHVGGHILQSACVPGEEDLTAEPCGFCGTRLTHLTTVKKDGKFQYSLCPYAHKYVRARKLGIIKNIVMG